MNIFEKELKFKIIPLGQNCMPRTILTRQKLKPSKFQGELTYPFDLVVFGMPEITKTLKTDFKEFFDNLKYENGCWIKAPNCIKFCHDKRFKENDKEKLINLYKKRIDNFRKSVKEEDYILFVQILGDSEEIQEQYYELKRIRNGKAFDFVVVDTENIAGTINLPYVHILKLEFPSQEYKNNWWKKEYYNTKEGKMFEKNITDFCLGILS